MNEDAHFDKVLSDYLDKCDKEDKVDELDCFAAWCEDCGCNTQHNNIINNGTRCLECGRLEFMEDEEDDD